MKVVILAGGKGTRISEESTFRPKPMVEICGQPILWHIMKEYSYYGFNEFIICAGYKQSMIKEYFADYYLHHSDITFDFVHGNQTLIHSNAMEPWKVTVIDTGLDTQTGGRLKRIKPYLDGEDFLMTYGDGVCDIDMRKLIAFHRQHGKLATITAVQPGGRFGVIDLERDGTVNSFIEKDTDDGGWINAGYMVLSPKVLDYIEGDETIFERGPLECLAREHQLIAYQHTGFWKCMDTLREKKELEELVKSGNGSWMAWIKKKN